MRRSALLLPLLAACASAPIGATATPTTIATATTTTTATATPTTTTTTTTTPLPFLDDDYPRALADAKAHARPLFIDAWAPWCHTCLSMRAYVFGDPALAPLAERFTWLSIDTERPSAAAFLAQFDMHAWPTLWVVDPGTEQPALEWLGSATASELATLLVETADGIAHGSAGGEATAARVRGDRASAAGRRKDAIAEYRAALAASATTWSGRARVAEALSARLAEEKDYAGCVDLGRAEIPHLPKGTALANVAATALGCATSAPKGSPPRKFAAALGADVARIAADRAIPLLADDRSGLYDQLVSTLGADGDAKGAARAAAAWAAFLEEQAASATTPAARAVFDAHRLSAYLALHQAARALPMLEASEHDFPEDYNAPARRARALFELGRHDEALAAIRRAIEVVYGPRTLRLRALEADILEKKGDIAGAAAAIHAAITAGETLALSGSYVRLQSDLKQRAAALTKRASAHR